MNTEKKTLTYADAGVDISAGDKASKAAYTHAKSTFASRKGMIGQPYELEGGFAGVLDMGDYLLVQNDDGTGTKSEIAERLKKYDTLGHDLCAMVADDAVCIGAEVISITNTLDTPKIDPERVDGLVKGLGEACREQKIVIPGGEIAEVGDAVRKTVWNATAVGVVKKDKFITGENVKPGDVIIGLKGRVLRSNGVSLARKACEMNFGEEWHNEVFQDGMSWGEVLLTPSKIYHRMLHDCLLGGFEGERKVDVKGIVHITGGGIPGNVPRIFADKSLGASFDNLHEPHAALKKLKELGNIEDKECYRSWHSGTAMMIIVSPEDAAGVINLIHMADDEVQAQVIGSVTDDAKITLVSKYTGDTLVFDRE